MSNHKVVSAVKSTEPNKGCRINEHRCARLRELAQDICVREAAVTSQNGKPNAQRSFHQRGYRNYGVGIVVFNLMCEERD